MLLQLCETEPGFAFRLPSTLFVKVLPVLVSHKALLLWIGLKVCSWSSAGTIFMMDVIKL